MRLRIARLVRAVFVWIGLIGVAISIGPLVIAAPPAVEIRLFPVVKKWRAVSARDAEGQTILHIYGAKVRACKYLGQDMQVVSPGGEASDVAAAWVDDPTPGSTRAPGDQDFGQMRIFTTPATPAGAKIVGVVRHHCHPGWETETVMRGPGFVVPPPLDGD
jgi:hypothetical protein